MSLHLPLTLSSPEIGSCCGLRAPPTNCLVKKPPSNLFGPFRPWCVHQKKIDDSAASVPDNLLRTPVERRQFAKSPEKHGDWKSWTRSETGGYWKQAFCKFLIEALWGATKPGYQLNGKNCKKPIEEAKNQNFWTAPGRLYGAFQNCCEYPPHPRTWSRWRVSSCLTDHTYHLHATALANGTEQADILLRLRDKKEDYNNALNLH